MASELRRELLRFAAALRLRSALHSSVWGIIVVLLLGGLASLMARLAPLWELYEVLLVSLWGIVAGAWLGGLGGYLWPRSWPRLLRDFDRQLHLADRCITAWELTQGLIHATPALAQAQIQDTVSRLQRHEPREAYPLRLTRKLRIVLSVLLLLFLPLLTLPNPQHDALARKRVQQQVLEATVEQLVELQADLAQDPTLSDEERTQALKALNAALTALRDRHSTPETRQAALSEAERQLATLRTPADTARVQRIAAAAPLSMDEIVQPFSEALARGDLQAAADYLNQLTHSQGRQLTHEEALALADAFNQMADSLQGQDPALAAQFRSVAGEIYTGDSQGAREAIRQATDMLSQAAQTNAHNRTLEQAQAQLQQAQINVGGQQASQMRSSGPQGSGRSSGSGKTGVQPGGQAGRGAASGQGDGYGATTGGFGHHEDAGSSAALGDTSAPRVAERGGELTLPRSVTYNGPPTKRLGVPDASRVPYREVYIDYAQEAEAELSRRAYPPAMRNYVRQYFSGLAP